MTKTDFETKREEFHDLDAKDKIGLKYYVCPECKSRNLQKSRPFEDALYECLDCGEYGLTSEKMDVEEIRGNEGNIHLFFGWNGSFFVDDEKAEDDYLEEQQRLYCKEHAPCETCGVC